MSGKDREETYSEDEAARRRDEVVRNMLNTPPKPRKGASKAASRKGRAKTKGAD